jgi:hypothetical protein
MGLVDHTERELRDSGLLGQDSDYAGMVGKAVLDLVKVFAAQGHSGHSAHMVIEIFSRVASYQLLGPLKNPMETKEYLEVSDDPPLFQSTRKSSVFSEDGGSHWYDIDKSVPWYRKIFGQRRAYISFTGPASV